jgi:hypothetical protein
MGLGPLGEGLPRPYKSEIHTLWKLNYSFTDHTTSKLNTIPKKIEKVSILMMMESWNETK